MHALLKNKKEKPHRTVTDNSERTTSARTHVIPSTLSSNTEAPWSAPKFCIDSMDLREVVLATSLCSRFAHLELASSPCPNQSQLCKSFLNVFLKWESTDGD